MNRTPTARTPTARTGPSRPAAGWILAAAMLLLWRSPAKAENVLEVGYAEVQPGQTGVELIVTASTDQPIHGYALAISFPAAEFTLREIGVEGTHVAALAPEFVAPRIDNDLGTATLGVILDFDAPITPAELSATVDSETGAVVAPHIIARLVFDVDPDAAGGEHAIRLVDGAGSPATLNRFTSAGRSIAPRLADGMILVEGGNVMSVSNGIAIAGATPNLLMTVFATHPDPLDGYTVAVSYDCSPGVIQLKDCTHTGTDSQFLVGEPEFLACNASELFECRQEAAILYEFQEPIDETRQLPPAVTTPQSILRLVFEVGAVADDERQWQDIVLDNQDDPVAANNFFFIGASSVPARVVHGKIFFSLGNLEGRVVRRLGGDPVPGCTVTLSPDPCPDDAVDCRSSVTTDAGGVFRFDGIMPGIYTAKLSRAGYYDDRHDGVLVEGSFTTSSAGDLPIYRIPSDTPQGSFIRGNANGDGRVDISDAIFVLNFLFRGDKAPACLQAADINNDDRNDISDAIWLLNFFFTGGQAVPPPNTCGPDPDAGPLTCEQSSCG